MENIIMYVADQWRSDSLKMNGNDACVTPNLEELANDGVNFENAFCQNPVCVPSRCSFLSGQYPHTSGHRTMHYLMREEEPNVLRTMKENGYEVFWCGRNDFLRKDIDPLKYCSKRLDPGEALFNMLRGNGDVDPKFAKLAKDMKINVKEWRSKENYYYSHYRDIVETSFMGVMDEMIIEESIKYLDEYDKSKPFFMYLTGVLPHPPYEIEEEWFDKIDMSKVDKPIRLTAQELEEKASILKGIRENQKVYNLSDEELIKIKAVYYAMGTKLDHYIGKLVKELKERDLYDTTTIIFFADHGDYTGDYEIVEKNQNTFEDMLTNVPLIIKPSKTQEVKVRNTKALVELIDVQATIMDIAGVTPEYFHFGKSLTDVIKGEDKHRDYTHTEGGRVKGEGSYAMDAGHTEENEYWPRTVEQTKIPEHTKAVMTRGERYKYVFRLYEDDELYDLENDKAERTNLFYKIDSDEELKKIYDELRVETLKFMVETGDHVSPIRDER